ncbi:MAG: hypothetical protein HY814_14215 [Candidatus Riflebacteria bacterium]|nr:hypothetical protein [Candidatus Riflebacteria bacterium]
MIKAGVSGGNTQGTTDITYLGESEGYHPQLQLAKYLSFLGLQKKTQADDLYGGYDNAKLFGMGLLGYNPFQGIGEPKANRPPRAAAPPPEQVPIGPDGKPIPPRAAAPPPEAVPIGPEGKPIPRKAPAPPPEQPPGPPPKRGDPMNPMGKGVTADELLRQWAQQRRN